MHRGREYHGCEEEYNVEKKGNGKQYYLPYNIKDVGKNIKRGRGQKFVRKNFVLVKWVMIILRLLGRISRIFL